MPKTITEAEKVSYHKLLKLGKGLLFLHHSLCSYQDWNEYKTIVGGKYHEEKNTPQSSTYQQDVSFTVKIADPKHPVTKGIKDFEILDEVYGNTEVLPEVIPLLTTNNSQSSPVIGWTHKKEKSRIVYIALGHDRNAYFNNSTLPDSIQGTIFQLFHPVPEGRKLKNRPFPLVPNSREG
jgi:type 1 glutamine amidotransferase